MSAYEKYAKILFSPAVEFSDEQKAQIKAYVEGQPMSEHVGKFEKPTGVIITDRLLSEADFAVLRKAVREYDGSMPLAEYLEKRLSVGIEYITFEGQNDD